jgi:transcriptional regulator with XRE-family HTH domain
MGPLEYKAERERRGTQEDVAALLGVSRVTIARRETGTRPVIREAWLALLALPKKRARAKRPNPTLQRSVDPAKESA